MTYALLIGSAAAADIMGRKPMDRDYIGTPDFAESFMHSNKWNTKLTSDHHLVAFLKNAPEGQRSIVEIEIAWPDSTGAELLERVKGMPLRRDDHGIPMADANILYALKMSHRYLRNSPHFLKTMKDIHTLRAIGAEIPGDMADWFKRREAETYTYKHPSLNQSKHDFFDGDGVNYTWDHDDIHKAVADPSYPAYMRYLEPGEEVKCSKELFYAATEYVRQRGVYEEAMVLAIERSIWPFEHRGSSPEVWGRIYLHALMKVCTSITSGWFREYAWENYYDIAPMFNKNDIHRFFKWVDEGKIRKFQS